MVDGLADERMRMFRATGILLNVIHHKSQTLLELSLQWPLARIACVTPTLIQTIWHMTIGRIASGEVTLHIIKSKCLPVLSYGLEVCPLNTSGMRSLDFVINRFFMKLFNTNVIGTVKLSGLFWFGSAQCYDWKAKKDILARLEIVEKPYISMWTVATWMCISY